MNKKIFAFIALTIFSLQAKAASEQKIERSSADKGKYFLLKKNSSGENAFKVITKRIGVDSIGYTSMLINCKTKKIKVLGYSEESYESIKENTKENWFDIVPGSSKYDTVNFVCDKKH